MRAPCAPSELRADRATGSVKWRAILYRASGARRGRGPAPDCCYGNGEPGGSNGCFFGPGNAGHDLCVADMRNRLCSDLTADPAELFACKPVLDADTAMCVDEGYVIPAACFSLIESNY